jgi:hypothetical protein
MPIWKPLKARYNRNENSTAAMMTKAQSDVANGKQRHAGEADGAADLPRTID